MKIRCQHGYYKFWEDYAGEISDFITLTGFDLVLEGEYYTFAALQDAPRYSVAGGEYLGALATKTFEGDPWDVMRANNLIYDFIGDQTVLISTVIQPVTLNATNRYFLSNGIIIAGSLTDDGDRVTDYAAFYIPEKQKFKYSEVTFG